MNDHINALRIIRERNEGLADQMLTLWGTPSFFVLIQDLKYSETEILASLNAEITAVNNAHHQLFPHFQVFTKLNLPSQLAGSEEFAKVNERFPHISDRLVSRWGTKDYLTYLEGILRNDSGKIREGFSLEMYSNLMKLSSLHAQLFPDLIGNPLDKWWSSFD